MKWLKWFDWLLFSGDDRLKKEILDALNGKMTEAIKVERDKCELHRIDREDKLKNQEKVIMALHEQIHASQTSADNSDRMCKALEEISIAIREFKK